MAYLSFGRLESHGLRTLVISLHPRWVWWYWLDEAGLLAIQIGPVVVEVAHG